MTATSRCSRSDPPVAPPPQGQRRCWAAAETLALGYGGVSTVAQATTTDPGLLAALEALVDPATRGDPPQSPLRWTCKSTSRRAATSRARHRTGSAESGSGPPTTSEPVPPTKGRRSTHDGPPKHEDVRKRVCCFARTVAYSYHHLLWNISAACRRWPRTWLRPPLPGGWARSPFDAAVQGGPDRREVAGMR
jgi:hypothetical protein